MIGIRRFKRFYYTTSIRKSHSKKICDHRRVARRAATGYRIRRWPSQTVVTDESWKIPSQGGGIHGGTR